MVNDPIEGMEKAGWKRTEPHEIYTPNTEVICFTRPKQKPNAIVDWEKFNNALIEFGMACGRRGFDIDPKDIIDKIDAAFSEAIKKAE